METSNVTSSPALTVFVSFSTVIVASLLLPASTAKAIVTHIVSAKTRDRNADSKRFLFFMFVHSFHDENVLYHMIHK